MTSGDAPAGPAPPAGGEPGDETLQGVVDLVTYRDPTSGFTVLRLLPEKGYSAKGDGGLFASKRATAVGRALEAVEGTRVRLLGRWGRHPTHGAQFEFDVLQPLPPADAAGLERYLASKTFEGVGPALARRIVARLGTGALGRIAEEPECLKGIRGLRSDVAANLRDTVRAQAEVHATYAFLHGAGLGPLQAQAAVTRLGPGCEGDVRRNPYLLTRVPGLGFLLADRVALHLGFAQDDPRRVGAAVLHVLGRAADDGHTLARVGDLVERARYLLRTPLSREVLVAALATLEEGRELVFERRLPAASEPWGDDVLAYLPWLYASEAGLAEGIARCTAAAVPPLADERALARAEEAAGITLHSHQREAVLTLLASPVVLLTGGPGVGKTTIVRFVASLAEAGGARVELASPTGRAAKRLAEATGRPARTVHRLLRYSPAADASGHGGFEHGRNKPLRAGLVIVDEISMLDVVLANHLFQAIEPPTRLVLVGDPDQLPSVGPGNVLADLLASGRLPVARLTHIYRQHEGSLIVTNAHRILAGELPVFPARGDTGSDFYMFPSEDPAETAALLVDVVTRRVPATFGVDWTSDVQVIAPMYRGECGVDALNDVLREAQGIGGREVVRGSRRWRLGDRVIHTRNDYEREVFNGDMGRVTAVTADGVVTVRYPEQDVTYTGGQLSDLRPAFAITVHRSQGCEFPVVVVPLVPQHAVMLQRNLLYTAVTRATRLVVLVGARRALAMAIANARQARRESALAARLAVRS